MWCVGGRRYICALAYYQFRTTERKKTWKTTQKKQQKYKEEKMTKKILDWYQWRLFFRIEEWSTGKIYIALHYECISLNIHFFALLCGLLLVVVCRCIGNSHR